MADRSVSLESETNKNRSEEIEKALTVSLNQTRAMNMRLVPCAVLIFQLHMAVGGTLQRLLIPV